MPTGQFIKSLFLIIAVCLVLTSMSYFIPILALHIPFSILMIVLFSMLSFGVYYIGNQLANSTNKYLYNNLIIINLMMKILMSLLAIVIYVKLFHPPNDWYLLIFISVYIIFTIFEVYFMTKQAKAKK